MQGLTHQSCGGDGGTSPRVFVSYVWESSAYREWVRRLAERLRRDGVDVRLDAWHLEDGLSIPTFMARECREADRVLVLCSPGLRQRLLVSEQGSTSSGIVWELELLPMVTGVDFLLVSEAARMPGRRKEGL